MKKIFAATALAISSMAFSQLNYVAEAGFLSSQLTFKPEAIKAGAKSGFYAGFGVERKWGEMIAIQIDCHYENLGVKYNIGNESVTVDMNRFQLPLSLRYYLTYELAIFGGGYLNMKLSNKVKTTTGNKDVEDTIKNYIDEKVSGADYGIHFGADYKIIKGLYVTAKYNIGMANLMKNTENSDEAKMKVIQAGVGYKF